MDKVSAACIPLAIICGQGQLCKAVKDAHAAGLELSSPDERTERVQGGNADCGNSG